MSSIEGRRVGKGRTLKDAFDDYAQQKAADVLDELGPDATRGQIQDRFRGDDGWFDVDIAVQIQPHNQWVRWYRVTDR